MKGGLTWNDGVISSHHYHTANVPLLESIQSLDEGL